MSVLDLKEIPQANTGYGDQDTFELFARDFFLNLNFEIETHPSRGADGGTDLIVAEPLAGVITKKVFRWLVSCKHYAHSGRSVPPNDEGDIPGRLEQFGCQGFIAFYSTLPSSGLTNKLESYKTRFGIEIFDYKRIEHFLVAQRSLRHVLRRYFPNSYQHLTQNYTWEKFYLALLTLATGSSSLHSRLVDAYTSSLIRLTPEDLPVDMRDEFVQLCHRLTSEQPVGSEGSVWATVEKMDEIEVKRIAEQIVSLYERYRTAFIDDMWSND